MKAFQLPPSPRTFVVGERVVTESFLPHPKGFHLPPLRSEAGWVIMPGRTRKERRKAYFSLKKKDRPE